MDALFMRKKAITNVTSGTLHDVQGKSPLFIKAGGKSVQSASGTGVYCIMATF